VTDIISVGTVEEPKYRIETNSSHNDNEKLYDAVFFAAPWHPSPISKSICLNFTEQIPYASPLRHRVEADEVENNPISTYT
jgi:hypothetical protein